MRLIILLWVRLIVAGVYRVYKEVGLNSLFTFLPAQLTQQYLRKHGAVIGDDLELNPPILFQNTGTEPGKHYQHLTIGTNVYLGKDCLIDLADTVTLEDCVTISMRVTILTHVHAGKSPLSAERLPPRYQPVILRRGCYIGANAVLLPGVEIGEEAIVAAGAVVTRSVPKHTKVAGVPAREI